VDSDGTKDGEVHLMEHLGLAPIHESLTAFTALRKGQQRLQDLKGGRIKIKTAKSKTKKEDSSATTIREATTDRRQGLLERIRGKELRQSRLPPPPSKEILLRRSAAERVEEVARVLVLLKPSGSVGNGPRAKVTSQRKPFRFETIVRNIQDSMRNPISDKEVAVCLEILTQPDVAGDWVNIVTVNQLKSVVLTSRGNASPRDIGAKVAGMKIGWGEHS
jgi:DNA replication factor Cdt1 C-terminal domain